jgi:hypothetical protein
MASVKLLRCVDREPMLSSFRGLEEDWMGGAAIRRYGRSSSSLITAGEAGEGVVVDNAGETLDGYVTGGHQG